MKLLGPVFWYDLVRIARRQRLAQWRAAYGLTLLAALFLLYSSVLPHAWLGGTHVKTDEAADFAGYFFAVFVAVQFAVVILLTPALAAGALAEERTRNTLVFLLTTQLTSREIVLGKLATRYLQVGLLVLTGLPVLGMLQFMGGVEPSLVLATFVALAATALSLAGLGLACAVYVKKPHNAAWRAYQVVFAFAVLSALSIWFWNLPFGRGTTWVFGMPGRVTGMTAVFNPPGDPTLFQYLLQLFNMANPYYEYLRIYYEQVGSALLSEILPAVLRDYVFAHVIFGMLLTGLAVRRLRAVAASQGTTLTYKKALILKAAKHPPILERPVLWKELYCESKPRQRWLALFFSRWFFFASFLPAWVFLVLMIDHNFGRLAEYTLLALRFGGTLVAVGLLLRVTLQAARSIGHERDRETLDSLLTTDLTAHEIVRDKWWGSYLCGRWVQLWLLIHWGLGLLPFALHPLALVLLLVECLVYGAFFVSLGMYCAARFPSTKQAAAAALVIGMVGTSLLPWAGGKLIQAALPTALGLQTMPTPRGPVYVYQPAIDSTSWPEAAAIGFTPVWVLYESVYPNLGNYSFLSNGFTSRAAQLLPWMLLGLLVYALAAFTLARLTAVRFHKAVRGVAPAAPRRLSGRPAPALATSSP